MKKVRLQVLRDEFKNHQNKKRPENIGDFFYAFENW